MATQTAPNLFQIQQERRRARQKFMRARKVENQFAVRLRSVARHIGELVRGYALHGTVEDFTQLRFLLNRYGEVLRPWAYSVVSKMHAEVSRKDAAALAEHSESMGLALRSELERAPTGQMLKDFLQTQVDLITSLPRKAAERVHELTIQGITEGVRAEDIQAEIMRTGKVTESRAMLIARTEVARTASGLTMTRAQFVGSEGYIWRTAEDSDVRMLHQKLEGKFFRWDEPPVAAENGVRAHAGMIYNCRCYPEPVLPEAN